MKIICDERLIAGQNVFSWHDVHSPRQACIIGSHQLNCFHEVCHFSRMHCQKSSDPWFSFTFGISDNTGTVVSRWWIHWSNRSFNPECDNFSLQWPKWTLGFCQVMTMPLLISLVSQAVRLLSKVSISTLFWLANVTLPLVLAISFRLARPVLIPTSCLSLLAELPIMAAKSKSAN